MQGWQAWWTAAAVAVATMSLLALLARRRKSDAEVLFAVVSGSMALSLMSPWLQDAPSWMRWAVAIGGCATCNGYWLVSRAFFRGPGGVGGQHVLIAAGVAMLIAAYRGSTLGTDGSASPWTVGLGGLLTLASSTLLVLTFLEALRGWSAQLPHSERRMRIAYMAIFATCVLATTVTGALARTWPMAAELGVLAISACSMAMIVFTHAALRHRHRVPMPLHAGPAPESLPARALDAEEARLAEALRHQLDTLQVYCEPELKVADLATRLGTAEHRLSRLISQGLGEKNFNQMINRHRIAHACGLLAEAGATASILEISGRCGFASLGPFNRSFKAAMGCTPTAYRAACLARTPPPRLAGASPGGFSWQVDAAPEPVAR